MMIGISFENISFVTQDSLLNHVMCVQCAGNRRTEMSVRRKVKGVGWGAAAIGTGISQLYFITLIVFIAKISSLICYCSGYFSWSRV